MRARDYELVAKIVNDLPADIRLQVADHFAKAFAKSHPLFDPLAWEARTGGATIRFRKETEQEKTQRVMAYVDTVLAGKRA